MARIVLVFVIDLVALALEPHELFRFAYGVLFIDSALANGGTKYSAHHWVSCSVKHFLWEGVPRFLTVVERFQV